jgi:hypothetical protein
MAVIMSDRLKAKLEVVKRRKWWPVASLAKELGCSKMFVYNKIDDGHFDIVSDIGFKRVSTESVLKYFEDRYMQKV